jgi:hypothetical protein
MGPDSILPKVALRSAARLRPGMMDTGEGCAMFGRRLVQWGLLAALVLAAAGALPLSIPENAISRASFDRIRKGMTLPQVEQVLGRAPDVVAPLDRNAYVIHIWYGPEGLICVVFSEEGAYIYKNCRFKPTAFACLRDWLGW